MKNYYINWWNLENLFDVEDSNDRPDYLKSRLRSELKGWNEHVLDKKLNQISSIIRQMNNGQGPEIIGVCEVENKPVMDKLVDKLNPLNRNYVTAHHDTSDNRGIDIAFIYDGDLFDFEGQFHYEVLKRSATRDLFQVNFRTKKGNAFILIGNHWPARSAGIYESEPYRIIAAETLSYWLVRIFEIRGSGIQVFVMGDFNDECFNRSVCDYALSTNSEDKVRYSHIPRLYNLMWQSHGQTKGTYYYQNFPLNIDQVLVSKGGILKNSPLRIANFPGGDRAWIETFPEMVSGGRYPAPIRFGRPSSKSTYHPDTGFSDHYPVSMMLSEK
ncbi:endonuclease/exonuclease/phosphatase [Rhodohalobacter sp. SW132]|uniref:endonuclease/exonuclease/phosphatase family protein n=1 Tax=Rhodohalobacter sp. SW132 TaxID=2293433 RepID=UPI000E28986B|nr:endonuclease/exonuclease/phosphatase family protein [Rhodohalobacter sp. SW132]REL24481.1 endonuclease/exonuclease/phosphatase [Rhodohalobacter sp. SW132]